MTVRCQSKRASGARKKLDDELVLSAFVEARLRRDPKVADFSHRIRSAQRRLQRATTKDAWQLYLLVEAISNERYEYVSRLLARRSRADRP